MRETVILFFLIKLVSCKTCLTNFTKGLKLRQIDKNQSFKNEKSCKFVKEHFGNESFSFNPIYDGPFRGCSRSHISYKDQTWHSYNVT